MARDLRLEAQESLVERDAQPPTPARMKWASTSERCDFMVLNAFFHALSPVNHDCRENDTLDTLWKLTIRSAYEPMVELYNRLQTGSLNDLLNASQEVETWAKVCCPPSVGEQLQLFITILKDEWTQLDTQLALEAQVAATAFPREVFYNEDRHNERAKRISTASLVKRKKVKRLGQPVGRLKPLAIRPQPRSNS
ncbi:hypothetical protein ON010_g5270 [Phytophthora cinnamomi]|nr:hypothetical protein ON010_g5270 [Phytophthora cinnamomi]